MHTALDPGNDIVRNNTSEKLNAIIDHKTRNNIEHYSAQTQTVIEARIEQLDKEWDIERPLELNAAAIAFTGVMLSATVSKKWLLLPAVVTGFLMQHAIQGWCLHYLFSGILEYVQGKKSKWNNRPYRMSSKKWKPGRLSIN